jgi:hypothetical protein
VSERWKEYYIGEGRARTSAIIYNIELHDDIDI